MTTALHELAPQLEANRRYWTGWAGSDPDAGLTIYRSGIGHSLLNGVLRVRDRPLDQAVEQAKAELAGTRWVWWAGPDSDEGTADGLLALGATPGGRLPIMAIDLAAVNRSEAPADLKIITVVDRPDVERYVHAYAEPLGFDVTDLGPVVDRVTNFGFPDVVRLAGVVDGRTVGTCELSLGTGVAGLFCIGTDREFQRRGIATALTLEALRIARDAGRSIATLQASAAGEPVYRRIGFETVGHYEMFSFPR